MTQRELISKYITKNKSTIILKNNAADLISDYLNHYIENYVTKLTNDEQKILSDFIKYTTTASVFFSKKEVYGWNLFIPAAKMKYFCSVDMMSDTFVARGYKYDPISGEKSRLILEIYSPVTSSTSKSISFAKSDASIEQIAAEHLSSQSNQQVDYITRENLTFIVQSINSSKDDFTNTIKEISLDKVVYESLTVLDTVSLTFLCGCDESKLKSVVSSIPKENLSSLFEKGDDLFIECPRCGKRYTFNKSKFDI